VLLRDACHSISLGSTPDDDSVAALERRHGRGDRIELLLRGAGDDHSSVGRSEELPNGGLEAVRAERDVKVISNDGDDRLVGRQGADLAIPALRQ